MSVTEQAKKHLVELEAFSKANPTVAKAITLQRLMKNGIDFHEARNAIVKCFQPAH